MVGLIPGLESLPPTRAAGAGPSRSGWRRGCSEIGRGRHLQALTPGSDQEVCHIHTLSHKERCPGRQDAPQALRSRPPASARHGLAH